MSLTVGQEFSHYKVLAPLGQGGMGVVYRARDTRLDRDVAIKVVPGDWAEDSELLQRLEREAKVLASLNHPHVAQIHAVETLESSSLLILELVEGEELATRIGRGALPMDEAVTICAQIAEGLESAHEAGVVHRDLKPANVRITPRGVAKVLDFGLAKAQHGDDKKQSMTSLTGEGVLVGTPTYMAPEAVRGQAIDRRADIWAFGCILYECLTGARPFQADSLADLMGAILEREPDLSRLPSSTPPLIRRLVTRCLDKSPRTRLQDMGEARIALTGGRGDELTGAGSEVKAGIPHLAWLMLLAPTVLLLLMVAIAWKAWPGPPPRNPLDVPHWSRLTIDGSEFDVDISPSGETLVFGSDRGGVVDMWRCSIDGGELENMTQGRFPLDDQPVRNTGLKGTVPVFHHALEVEGKLLAQPGAAVEVAAGPEAVEPDWTRDGSRVVYHTSENGDPIYVHETGSARGEPLVRGEEGEHLHYPTWSFDEKWIFYSRGNHLTWQVDLYRIRVEGTVEQRLTTDQLLVSHPTPIDVHTVLFLGHDREGAGPWLWSLDLDTLQTRRLTFGLERFTSLAVSGDGRTLVATVANPTASLHQIPIPAKGEAVVRESDVQDLPGVPSLRALAPRYADGSLFYLSSRGGGDGLFMAQGGMARELQPDRKEPLVYLPSVSPDGRSVALIRSDPSRMRLSLIDVESRTDTVADRVPDLDVHGDSGWDPTSTWIVVAADTPQGTGLHKVSAVDGSSTQLVEGRVAAPAWSPTEDLIIYGEHKKGGPWYTLRGVSPQGEAVDLKGEDVVIRYPCRFRFLPDGSGLIFMKYFDTPDAGLAKNFQWMDLSTGEVQTLTDLEQRGHIRAFDLSPDGTHIVFDRTHPNSDVVVIPLGARDP